MLSRLLCRLALLVLCIPFLILLGHVEEVLIDVTLVEVCLVLVLFSELLDVHFVQFLSRFALFLELPFPVWLLGRLLHLGRRSLLVGLAIIEVRAFCSLMRYGRVYLSLSHSPLLERHLASRALAPPGRFYSSHPLIHFLHLVHHLLHNAAIVGKFRSDERVLPLSLLESIILGKVSAVQRCCHVPVSHPDLVRVDDRVAVLAAKEFGKRAVQHALALKCLQCHFSSDILA
jgi:hypothetical protein